MYIYSTLTASLLKTIYTVIRRVWLLILFLPVTYQCTGMGLSTPTYTLYSPNYCPPSAYSYSAHICTGRTYMLNGKSFSMPGTYNDTLRNHLGCDSFVTLTLYVDTDSTFAGADQSICYGSKMGVFLTVTGGSRFVWTPSTGLSNDTIINPTATPTVTTTYIVSSNLVSACKTTDTVVVRVRPQITHTATVKDSVICMGDSTTLRGNATGGGGWPFFYNWSTDSLSGLGTDTVIRIAPLVSTTYYFSANNTLCAVADTLRVRVKPTSAYILNKNICSGNNYPFKGAKLTAAGMYYDTLKNHSACDSIITLHLSVLYPTHDTLNLNICPGQVFTFDGHAFDTSGTLIFNLKNMAGCDSVVVVHLTYFHTDTSLTLSHHTLIANDTVGSYQWINCYTHTIYKDSINRRFTPRHSGSYCVAIITADGCMDTSYCHYILYTGITAIDELPLYVYPNPAQNKIYIDVGSKNTLYHAVLYNIHGIAVAEKKLNDARNSIDISKLSDGVYELVVQDYYNHKQVYKIVKEN